MQTLKGALVANGAGANGGTGPGVGQRSFTPIVLSTGMNGSGSASVLEGGRAPVRQTGQMAYFSTSFAEPLFGASAHNALPPRLQAHMGLAAR